MKLTVQEAQETGKKVIEARRIAKSYGGLTVVRDFSIKIARGDRIGIVGPNGAGKTTLINLLTGALAPDAATCSSAPISRSPRSTSGAKASTPRRRLAATLTGGSGDR